MACAPPGHGGDALDAALLARASLGEGGAARALAARRAPALIAVATRLLGDAAEAEDVAQEAFLRLWRAAPDFSGAGREAGGGSVGGWLRRTTRNLCLDRLRRRGRLAPMEAAPEPSDPAPSALERVVAADRAAALSAAIAALPDRQRVAVTLRHLEGLANPEIAEALGVGVEAVESLLARARRTLAARLAAHREDRE
ncbi:sigma-70 family RNA polymerase sigma factor [Rubrimonas cliftonensis]|uniref:sigma-70 family RNA polymerase sigma factor n=1 Tax=Rubrimonas cliftonensis TaxID=89524 RepID=UPI000B8586CE|nr:sigma-70 family RNA polymerase sigma factor [Rubrimonas cliftonensis]